MNHPEFDVIALSGDDCFIVQLLPDEECKIALVSENGVSLPPYESPMFMDASTAMSIANSIPNARAFSYSQGVRLLPDTFREISGKDDDYFFLTRILPRSIALMKRVSFPIFTSCQGIIDIIVEDRFVRALGYNEYTLFKFGDGT